MRRSLWWNIWRSLRPEQWTKNLFVLAPLIFAGNVITLRHVLIGLGAFLNFCLLSGGLYIFNDLIDIEADRQHPRKRTRPLASGALSPSVARLSALALIPFALALSTFFNFSFFLLSLSFAFLMIAYTLLLKGFVILDLLAIAYSFAIRAEAGASAIGIPASPWLILCTMLLAILLAAGKRRGELIGLKANASAHREVLGDYSVNLLDQILSASASSCIISYALYTFFSPTAVGHPLLVWTIPFVIYGVLRYLYLVHKTDLAESPDQAIVKDIPLLYCVIIWAVVCLVLIRI